jgi:hypothetical protein
MTASTAKTPVVAQKELPVTAKKSASPAAKKPQAKAPVKATKKAIVKPAPVKPTSTKVVKTQPTLTPPQAPKAKPSKEKKVKVVRDSFTIPKPEFTQIAEMKKRALSLGVDIKKSELIRAGLQIVSGLPDASFKKALAAIPTVKTGRPSKA